MSLTPLALEIRRGATVDVPIFVEAEERVFVAISAVTSRTPLRVTATAHGMPPVWRACLQNLAGMSEMNVRWNALRAADLRRAVAIDANTVEFPDVNAAGFRAYTHGGQLVYFQPLDLSLYSSAELQVRTEVDGATVAEWSSAAGTLQIDAASSALWIRLTDAQSEALPAGDYLFDIELTRATGGIDAVCAPTSTLTVLPQITI